MSGVQKCRQGEDVEGRRVPIRCRIGLHQGWRTVGWGVTESRGWVVRRRSAGCGLSSKRPDPGQEPLPMAPR